MTGPHHSIIAFFTSAGHGAAAWMAIFMLLTSYLLRTSSGSLSMRMNMVGTHWLWVTLYFSMAARASSGSKRSIMITVPPTEFVTPQYRSGAAWYSGAGDR